MDKTDFDEICFHTVCPDWECIMLISYEMLQRKKMNYSNVLYSFLNSTELHSPETPRS